MQKPTSSPLPPSLEEIDAAPLQGRGLFGGILGPQKSGPDGRAFDIGIEMAADVKNSFMIVFG
jgi:hypothetical protein